MVNLCFEDSPDERVRKSVVNHYRLLFRIVSCEVTPFLNIRTHWEISNVFILYVIDFCYPSCAAAVVCGGMNNYYTTSGYCTISKRCEFNRCFNDSQRSMCENFLIRIASTSNLCEKAQFPESFDSRIIKYSPHGNRQSRGHLSKCPSYILVDGVVEDVGVALCCDE